MCLGCHDPEKWAEEGSASAQTRGAKMAYISGPVSELN